jgi:hypothetical protein
MIAVNKNQEISSADPIRTVLSEPPVPAQISEQVETADGARAIEVAALFDDAVLEVRHLDSPSAGRMTGMTRAILGSATAALLGTGALFAHSYLEVAAEKRAEQTSESRPAHKKGSGRTRDGAAGGLLFYGVSALLYGLHRAGRERRENEFSIGTARDATFKMDAQGLPGDRFPLVRSNGTDYEFLFTASMTGELTVNGKRTSLAELQPQAQPAQGFAGALSLVIPEGARLSVNHDSCSFLIRSVPRPRHYPVPLRLDWRAQTYTGAVLLGAASFLGIMFAVPPDPRSLALDAFSNEHIARYLVKAPQVEENAEWLKAQPKTFEKSGGKAAAEKSGTIGKDSAPKNNNSHLSVKGPKNNPDPKIAAQQAREAASNMGILRVLQGSTGTLALVMAKTSALGNDAQDALSSLNGTDVTDAYGNPNAMGFIGSGHGGDGTGDNTIGMGPWGKIGRGPGPGGPGGYHPAAAKLACKDCGNAKPTWTIGQPELKGNYDPSLIRRVVRQHMNEVKFCYEKELTRDASLAGRVVVKFSIGGMGNVTTSFIESSTIKAGSTDRCIAEAVRRWEFPKPNGGLVIVSYPFVLKSVNGAE